MFKYISHSEDETINFACKLASKLKNGDLVVLSGDLGSANKIAQNANVGDIIILTGDLGAGKTKFVEGFLENFGLQNEISSPTFNIVNEYKTPFSTIYHFDVYRLQDEDEFYAIGGEEYLNKGICIIEWGEIIESILPKDYIKVIFERDPENDDFRILNFEVHGDRLLPVVKEVLESENT